MKPPRALTAWLRLLAPVLAYYLAAFLLRAAGVPAALTPILMLPFLAVWYWKARECGGQRAGRGAIARAGLRWMAAGACFGVAARWAASLVPGAHTAIVEWTPIALAAACLAGPACEELVFRGLVMDRAKALVGSAAAVFIGAALFAAGHGLSFQAAVALPFGLLLGWARLRTDSMIAPILAHVAANAVQLAPPRAEPWIFALAAAALTVDLIILSLCRRKAEGDIR